jgi:hypothetical protein
MHIIPEVLLFAVSVIRDVSYFISGAKSKSHKKVSFISAELVRSYPEFRCPMAACKWLFGLHQCFQGLPGGI